MDKEQKKNSRQKKTRKLYFNHQNWFHYQCVCVCVGIFLFFCFQMKTKTWLFVETIFRSRFFLFSSMKRSISLHFSPLLFWVMKIEKKQPNKRTNVEKKVESKLARKSLSDWKMFQNKQQQQQKHFRWCWWWNTDGRIFKMSKKFKTTTTAELQYTNVDLEFFISSFFVFLFW